jgi:endonuclease-8
MRHERAPGPSHVAHLGPDLCTPEPDLDDAVARMAQLHQPTDEIADVLLDQRVAAGIGNVYKSEVLWARRVSPFAPLASLDDDVRRVLVDTAHRLLRANLGSGARETVPAGLGVYGRARQPCRRCGTPIRMRRQGPQVRSTYWCPRCQPEPVSPDRRDGPVGVDEA